MATSGQRLLGGKSKTGKSTFVKQIAEDVSLEKKVLYLASEYNERMAQGRFYRFKKIIKYILSLKEKWNEWAKLARSSLTFSSSNLTLS